MATDIGKFLKITLKKINNYELHEVLSEWNFLPERVIDSEIDLEMNRLKADLTLKIARVCLARHITADDVANLDLHVTSRHSNSLKWTMYEMKRGNSDNVNDEFHVPQTFLDTLYKYLNNFHDVNVNMMSEEGMIWVRVYFTADTGQYMKANIVYICHYTKTNFMAISRAKIKHKEYLQFSLKQALSVDDLVEMKLTGKDVRSLFQLALNRSNLDLGRMWSSRVGQNPLLRPGKRKREDYDENDERINRAELPLKRKREGLLVDLYGADQLPTVDKIEYKLNTTFRGRAIPEMSGEPFACTVKLEGNSVLEGVRALVKAGIMSEKMPGHVKRLPFMATNHVTLANRS